MYVVFLSGSESDGLLSFVYICIDVMDPVIKKGRLPINRFKPTIFVPVPSQDLDFQHHMLWSILCSVSSVEVEVIVGFIGIGGIVDHHCLNFLFIIYISSM